MTKFTNIALASTLAQNDCKLNNVINVNNITELRYVCDYNSVCEGQNIDVDHWIDYIVEHGVTSYVYDLLECMAFNNHRQHSKLYKEYSVAMFRDIDNQLIEQQVQDYLENFDSIFESIKVKQSHDELFLF